MMDESDDHSRCNVDDRGAGHGHGDGKTMPPSSPFAQDDGTADDLIARLLSDHSDHGASLRDIVDRLREIRVLIPMMAELVADSVTAGGLRVDKEAATGVVAVAAPDGRTALPVFTSMATMARWHESARPVPVLGARAALASVAEGWAMLIVDPAGPHAAVIPRPAVWAMAQQQPWESIMDGATVTHAVADHIAQIVQDASPAVKSATCVPDASGPERVIVQLELVPGLNKGQLDDHLARVNHALASSQVVAERIDALALRLTTA